MYFRVLFYLFLVGFLVSSCNWNVISSEQTSFAIESQREAYAYNSSLKVDQNVIRSLVDRVISMSKIEINNLSDSEILYLGAPLQKLTDYTPRLNEEKLANLNIASVSLFGQIKLMDDAKRNELISVVESLIDEYYDSVNQRKVLSAALLRQVFLDIVSTNSHYPLCSVLFDTTVGSVILVTPSHSIYPAGGLGFANTYCPSGSKFLITNGRHTNSKVINSRDGNTWIGLSRTVIDGEENLDSLFENGMSNNVISGFFLVNYREFGIQSKYGENTKNVLISNVRFENIGVGLSGQDFGAVMFESSRNITVTDCFFKNVTSAVRYKSSYGPLKVINNKAHNTGRNFFQCSNCYGSGIRINGNTMEYTKDFGSKRLEDWINLFNSEGLPNDYIQVNYNLARGNALNHFHVFINLGDHGGKYMEAQNNIGINPGAAGIFTSGGHYMVVRNNIMYSDKWIDPEHVNGKGSNVAYTSRNESYFIGKDSFEPCSNHNFYNNVANWTNHAGLLTKAYVPPVSEFPDDARCGLTHDQILNQTTEDTTVGPKLWSSYTLN